MTSRERFKAAFRHQQPDRVPIDLGGTSLTGMRKSAQNRLAEVLGFRGEGPRANHGFDERIMQWAGTDFRSVGKLVDLPSPHTRQLSPTANIDYWGCRWDFIDGEWQLTGNPLANVTTVDELQAYAWPEPVIADQTLRQFEADAKRLRDEAKYVVVAEHPICGVMELGCWLFGYDRYLEAMGNQPDLINAFSDNILDIQLKVIDQYYGAVGPYIDLTINGDDFGTQTGPFLSPQMFDTMIAPYFAERIRRIKQSAPQCLFWHHSCGSVFALLENILRCGVDILNPIQTSAYQMEPALLKQHFGDRLTFWGAMDVQQFLPHATPDQVRCHARWLVDTLGKDGGYVMAGAHEILDDIPPENIIAWIEAVR
jgi:uroporphyrinogen decarboxylase